MQYPSSLEFIKVKNGIKVKYGKNSKYSPDIWAMSYLLNERIFEKGTINTVYLGTLDPTMVLRAYFLPQIFPVFNFLPDVSARAETIIRKIKKREYITYEHNYNFKDRGTKDKQESMLEENIYNNLSQYFSKEFNEDKKGIRQFPANFFAKVVKETTRIGRKFWVDILTVNKLNQLSVIELKAGKNVPLDLFIQAIDYGIFAHLFKEHISGYQFIKNSAILSNKVAIYLVAERFHPAIIGDKITCGIVSQLKKNDLFDIHLIQFEKDGCKIKQSKEVLCI